MGKSTRLVKVEERPGNAGVDRFSTLDGRRVSWKAGRKSAPSGDVSPGGGEQPPSSPTFRVIAMNHRDVFEELFVLEMANNHWGSVERGLEIIRQHSRIVRFNNVRAAIKLQFRDVDN